MPIVEHLAGALVANVRLALKRLREAALEEIPDLDAVAPNFDDGVKKWTNERYRVWVEAALRRSMKAIGWRDRVLTLMGSTQVANDRNPDPEWPHERLCEELGYHLSRRVRDEHGKDVRDEFGEIQYEPDPIWGPPETLLGEFYRDEDLEAARKRRGDDKQQFSDYIPRSSPSLYLGDARTFLGDVPWDLCRPMPFALLTGRIGHWKNDYDLAPEEWFEYAEIILQQCLLVRARALELCAWCDQRLNVLHTAMYPIIRIGPALKGRRNRRPLRVEVAGQKLKLTNDTIPDTHADYLLRLSRGGEATFNRKYASELTAMIPPLSGLLRPTGKIKMQKNTGPKRDRNKATYVLDPGVTVVEVELSAAM